MSQADSERPCVKATAACIQTHARVSVSAWHVRLYMRMKLRIWVYVYAFIYLCTCRYIRI
jgi:hypothetical protein